MEDTLKKAYDEGYAAFLNPEPTLNPYNPKENEYNEWERGFQEAEEDAQQDNV